MKSKGFADLPLHSGKCPKWLFPYMRDLSGKISEVIVDEYGENELLNRLSDPYWFQAFGCVLGFDWHSSGLTTTTCGALKESLSKLNIGIGVAGGKGKTSKKAPLEIQEKSDLMNLSENHINQLIKTSRLSAKVDNSLLQDNFNLYHHVIFFTKNNWAVIQQGMNQTYARRYHWLNRENLDFINEPHNAIVSDKLTKPFNLIDSITKETKKTSLDLIKENPYKLRKYFSSQTCLFDFSKPTSFKMKRKHFPQISLEMKSLIKAYEQQPSNYQELVLVNGIGKKNLRALALISNLVHGTELSWKDPVKFSFAHGGKDGWPHPVDKKTFSHSIEFLNQAINDSKINNTVRMKCIKKLNNFNQSFLRTI